MIVGPRPNLRPKRGNNMFCIGLTGTIASGKSTVAACFKALGIQVISADAISKALTAPNQPALQQILEHFGSSILTHTGELNRRALRELIFTQATERVWLENLLHPLIRQQIEIDIQTCNSPYCIIEIPLLKNKLDYPYLNRVLLILADSEVQMARIIMRDQCSKKHASSILASQPGENQYRALADDVVFNNASLDILKEKIVLLHAGYLTLADL